MQPTSNPTTVLTPRQFYCDNSLNCESNNFVNCTFFSPHIIFNVIFYILCPRIPI
jgi:hypothetical protein